MQRTILTTFLLIITTLVVSAEDNQINLGRITGNYQVDVQMYNKDSLIGAQDVPEKVLTNGFLFLNYTLDKFSASIRYENYTDPILGFDPRYKGSGIAYRNAEYKTDDYEVTAGNFYEQYGSGLILRSYQEQQLGLDNSFDGVRVKFNPLKGIEIKGLIGKQRYYWTEGDGIVRGADMNVTLGDLFGPVLPGGYDLILGGSAVSNFQQSTIYPYTNLPNNVLSWSGRAALTGESVNADLEYSYKSSDPNGTNKFNFNPGYGLIFNTSIFGSGYGFSLNLHKIDNMDFRSDRTARSNDLLINFVPPITKQEDFRLMTLYPYSTQLNGEVGLQGDFTYTLPVNSYLGGEYGTTINLNYSRVQAIDTTNTLMDTIAHTALRYDSPFFGIGKRLYYQGFNIEISHRFSNSFKSILSILNTIYDKDIMENEGSPLYGRVYSTAAVLELFFRINDKNAIRTEFQHLWSKQDSTIQIPDNTNGNWAMGLIEYTIAPTWYFSVMSEYNYGNATPDRRINYISTSITYVKEGFRIQGGWGAKEVVYYV